ncbi:50S ribosomal protein L24 [Candidatus Peregrinibacteria bacterium CG08_land_8_20_14_0_20_41_10]|nr:MAG: 50S ribosomal protein L24 [Candidatus Peregrinibacteria bacterium CG1_02_41_10]PIS32271.1 MAG: 50S ribosomal protein L24 [Candidatus Peregrinibacteria bacterium CG08_land_8_20_14_0_20_41_10]
MKIKTGDLVVVTKGKFKGKKGKVLRTLKEKQKVVVEKINLVTRHLRKTSQKPGEVIKKEAPLEVANVKLVCPHCAQVIRVGYKKSADGKKNRICKKCSAVVDIAKATIKEKK